MGWTKRKGRWKKKKERRERRRRGKSEKIKLGKIN